MFHKIQDLYHNCTLLLHQQKIIKGNLIFYKYTQTIYISIYKIKLSAMTAN